MVLRFLKDYRSRAWMCRYHAGAVVDVAQPEVVAEAIGGGYAQPVIDESVVDTPAADEAVEGE